MVAAMGPLGVEGMFRRSCEITLRILRAQSETLMSVLRPFVYDPMVTWRSTSASARPLCRKENVETTNELVCFKMSGSIHPLFEYLIPYSPRLAQNNILMHCECVRVCVRAPARVCDLKAYRIPYIL
jgi:phosphatidylinositol kinase/protein kinase (PI-3  family)